MPQDIVISVENLTKIYKLYNSPVDRLKESLHPLRKQYHHDFFALNDVCFEIRKGESVGIVGKNGSGKSTLLKILTGVLTPTSGSVQVNGRVSALLELGAGFNPELTGIENVYFNGMLMGYTRDEMDEKLDDILSFADIGEFVRQPVKTYSSGMFVRLAFAVAVNVEPEILIIDEALSVGDVIFQQKCLRRMDEFLGRSVSILFVSHDIVSIKTLCNKSIYLKNGKVQSYGTSKAVTDHYVSDCLKETYKYEQPASNKQAEISSEKITIVSSGLLDNEYNEVISEHEVTIYFNIKMNENITKPIYGFHIRNRHGVSVFETSTHCMKITNPDANSGDYLSIRFSMVCNLAPGDYSVSFGFTRNGYGRDQFEEVVAFIHDVIVFKVVTNESAIIYGGCTNLFPKVELISLSSTKHS